MASGIFAILDDVALLLDDAAVMSKVAAKKTAGILGDDLAINAEKATGFQASRELPVIWAITKGSMLNKLIILPLAFLLSSFAPALIIPILLIGGAYLCYEGLEKILEWFIPHQPHRVAAQETSDPKELLQREHAKIRSAVRTDFILSVEIIVLALGTVLDQSLPLQILVVSFVALLATVGVYGLVALLVRMDDVGGYLVQRASILSGTLASVYRGFGNFLIAALPRVIRLLSVVGTVAMLLVGGGIFAHNIDWVHHALAIMPTLLGDLVAGCLVGLVVLLSVKGAGKLKFALGA
ncbi:MAG: DUF808 domain-containing protein [Motiliproteus sp.]